MLISLIIFEALVFVKVEAAEIKRNLKVKSLHIWVGAFFKLEACSITLNEMVLQTLKTNSYFLTPFEPLI